MKTSCKDVFLSCNTEQIKGIDEAYKILEDDPQYLEMGPLTALLSAHKNHPDASLLLLGCDYPLINSEHLLLLQKNRSINMEAVCFVNASDRFPEPLLAIYENKFLKKIAQNYQLYNASLRQMLSKAKIKSIAEDSLQLMSVDTPEDFFEMKKRLGNK
jgi:molybdopterin-guanine dinucleotide biosynthesis protein A